MDIIQILNDWGILIPNEEWFMEYLCNNKKENIYYIDKFPLKVGNQNADKFDQMDIFYQEVFLGEASKDDFLNIELKYRNIMNKLWIYNNTFIEFIISEKCFAKPSEIIDNKYIKYLPLLNNTSYIEGLSEITQKDEMEFWVQLGIRDIGNMIFYLKNYQAIIMPSGSYFIVYLNDAKFYTYIKDIVFSEGLFFRHLT